MNLCVIIPAYNEQETLPQLLADIPRAIAGVDSVKVIVINDGSNDLTAKYAYLFGADAVVNFTRNRGLAAAFEAGINTALAMGADIIVNLDADYQYLPSEIPLLIAPILKGEADVVIGDRQTDHVKEFSWLKRRLQRLGSGIVQRLAKLEQPIDAVSGFRAFSADAALHLNLVSSFSYATEMILQAHQKGLAIASVPITRQHTTRESRLFRNMWQHVTKTAGTMARAYLMYAPLKVVGLLSIAFGSIGALLLMRLAIVVIRTGDLPGHIQSLTVGLAMSGMAVLLLVLGILADLVAINRKLLEDTLLRVKRIELGLQAQPTRADLARWHDVGSDVLCQVETSVQSESLTNPQLHEAAREGADADPMLPTGQGTGPASGRVDGGDHSA